MLNNNKKKELYTRNSNELIAKAFKMTGDSLKEVLGLKKMKNNS